jgi:prophage maintenance system killer protein
MILERYNLRRHQNTKKSMRKRTWYPTENFISKTHKIMLEGFGGHPGIERGLVVFNVIIEEAKREKGIYRKAATFLRRIVVDRIFKDGNHRTAFEVTKTSLEMNGKKIKINDTEKIIRFN